MRRVPSPRAYSRAPETHLLACAVVSRVDPRLEYRGRLEHHDAARRDRHFLAGLGIATDPLALLAYHERSERGKLHGFAALETIGKLFKHPFDQRRRFGARQADLLVDRFAQIGTRHRFPSHRPAPLSAIPVSF